MKSIERGYLVFALALFLPAAGSAQVKQERARPEPATHSVVTAGAVAFTPLDIPGFPTGTKIAVLHGDPNAASGDYTIRLSFPDGYQFPAHWHPGAEHLTVLEGSLMIGMGNKADIGKEESYAPGTFIYFPGRMSHFGGAKGATVIQLHGVAPFKIVLSKPATTK